MFDRRASSRKRSNSLKNESGYAGIGIAMLTRIESTVRVTIRHSDSAATASDAATALVNREDATVAGRP